MKKLNEKDIIQFLARHVILPDNVHGIGDDAAVIHRDDHSDVITKDLLIEDQHFRLRYYTPAQLAKKALHVNLSDIIAMGAKPDYVFLGLGIPSTLSPDWLEEFLHHIKLECQKANVYLLGGDTTFSPHGLILSLTVVGYATATDIKYRSGANVSDIICVLGQLGEAHAGLLLLEQNRGDFPELITRTLSPTALIEEGQWLGKEPAVTAMLDISDGLYIDLKRLCDASQVGAIINVETLPNSAHLERACPTLSLTPIECALIGGEDYGLLFTVKKEAYATLKASFKEIFNTPFSTIGIITDSKHLALKHHNQPYFLSQKPFSHFNEEI